MNEFGNRYLAFGGDDPQGGAADLEAISDDLDFMLTMYSLNNDGQWLFSPDENKSFPIHWWHILDTWNNRIVAGSEDKFEAAKRVKAMVSRRADFG